MKARSVSQDLIIFNYMIFMYLFTYYIQYFIFVAQHLIHIFCTFLPFYFMDHIIYVILEFRHIYTNYNLEIFRPEYKTEIFLYHHRTSHILLLLWPVANIR